MLGWEFPPFSVGGLGNVCYHLTNAIARKGIEVSLILPMKVESKKIRILPTNVSLNPVRTILSPYLNEETYQIVISSGKSGYLYGGNLKEEVERYTKECEKIIKKEKFDLIHCHDWMTFKAGMLAKKISGKPLILHVHTTEFDRSGGLGNEEYAYQIEKAGFENADKIIAVSNFLKNRIINYYGIDEGKIEVVHNAIDFDGVIKKKTNKKEKVVLYFGRITLHKGPDYFIRAAKRVLDVYKDVVFVMAGTGEMLPKMIELSAELGIADRVLFTGYLSDEEVKKIYQLADLYVLPSVSEPFGLTVLEAVSNGTPVLLSKNSGVREVLRNCLLVDFWDVNDMANKIIAALTHTSMRECLIEGSYKELQKISWDEQANKVIDIYNKLNNW